MDSTPVAASFKSFVIGTTMMAVLAASTTPTDVPAGSWRISAASAAWNSPSASLVRRRWLVSTTNTTSRSIEIDPSVASWPSMPEPFSSSETEVAE